MERLLTLKEVCDVLGCKDRDGRYVRNLRDKGLIEGAKFGRNLMFKESSVEKFIDSQFKNQNQKVRVKKKGA